MVCTIPAFPLALNVALRARSGVQTPAGGDIWKWKFLLQSHPSGGKGVSPVQGEAVRRRYIYPEYLSYSMEIWFQIGLHVGMPLGYQTRLSWAAVTAE